MVVSDLICVRTVPPPLMAVESMDEATQLRPRVAYAETFWYPCHNSFHYLLVDHRV